MFTVDELKLLAVIVNDFLCDKSGSYIRLMDDILNETLDPQETLIEFFSYILLIPSHNIQETMDLFFRIPFSRMPLYVIPKINKDLKVSSNPCPSLKEGPYPWQSILARWRLKIQK